ncbi:PucR family transcriptional regulator [Kitasatospora azatica]|uniref:PucR family transcriptional regulator n=1 Tax=Kitasatospora azatica TaxID=58347 RepID=UPI00068AA0FD|nr:helix-turn-helix domain-containing protein [Kitasatospora azatica]
MSTAQEWGRPAPDQTLDGLLALVGSVVSLSTAPQGLGVLVRRVVVLDPLEPGVRPGDLLVAVGVDPQSEEAAALLRTVGRGGAAGVVFREEGVGPRSAVLRAAAAEAGTAVLLRTAWADWASVIGALRAGLAVAGAPEIANVPLGDLDRLAEAIALLVGGAVTIENRESRVLAYSSTDAELDPIRQQTILAGQVPLWRRVAMQEAGFFRALWGSAEVLHRRAEGEIPERLVVAVRAGSEPLGSIWVAAAGQPLPPTAADALRTAAQAAAAHLLHDRSRRSGQDELVLDAARALLDGRGSADVLTERTGLPRAKPCAVLSVCTDPAPAAAGQTGDRLANLVFRHCAERALLPVVVPSRRGVLVLLGNLEQEPAPAAAQVSGLSESLAGKLSAELGLRVRVGIGEVRGRLDQAPDSRRTADLALRALLFGNSPRSFARAEELADAVALLYLLDALHDTVPPVDTPVSRLVRYTTQRGEGALLDTLRAYLDHSGDRSKAAEALAVHRNTFKYRLDKLPKVCGIDLDDPDARLLAQLQLRLLGRDPADEL